LEADDLQVGQVYTPCYHIDANHLCTDCPVPFHETYGILPGEVFMIIDVTEIPEIDALDVEILFERKKMWFTFHKHESMIDNVRRAESYDIPFVALQEVETGSNSSSFQTSPHPPTSSGEALLTFTSFLEAL
jgi:hypothetical protein